MPIRLDSPTQIPEDIRRELRRFDSVFTECDFLDMALENRDLCEIAGGLDALCLEQEVVGYHFSRAVPEQLSANGLRVARGADRRRDFLARYGRRFSDARRQFISETWDQYFDAFQDQVRDRRIWFNFTLGALGDGGADRLLTYFGGEVIYMPLTRHRDIAAVLRRIGRPLIVECALDPRKLQTFCEIPWGKIWLSTYHAELNGKARRVDMDAYSEEPISVEQIISINVASRIGRSDRWRWHGSD